MTEDTLSFRDPTDYLSPERTAMSTATTTITDLAEELHATESDISLRVGRLIHDIGQDHVIHEQPLPLASMVGYGATELVAEAADMIRQQLAAATH